MVLCSGTGSVDEVFKLAGFKVLSVDWRHAFTDGKSNKDLAAVLLDITRYEPEMLHFGIFIKTSQINDKTRDSGLSSGSLIRSSYSWKTPRVTIHDNDTPRSLISTLGMRSSLCMRSRHSARTAG